MAGTTFTWNGGTGDANDPSNWTPNGNPDSGDIAIIPSGNAITPAGSQLNNNTVDIGNGTISLSGDPGITYFTPTLDNSSTIQSMVTSTAVAAHIVAAGSFINQGFIAANGTLAGSSFTIDITADGTNPGYFINYYARAVFAPIRLNFIAYKYAKRGNKYGNNQQVPWVLQHRTLPQQPDKAAGNNSGVSAPTLQKPDAKNGSYCFV